MLDEMPLLTVGYHFNITVDCSMFTSPLLHPDSYSSIKLTQQGVSALLNHARLLW